MNAPHLASGDIPVEYGTLPYGNDGIDATVMKMAEMAYGKWGARSPKIRAAALNIINGIDPITGTQIGWPVREKDYYGMIKAIHNYVRDNIRYVKDVASWDAETQKPINQETLSYPEEILFNSQGEDCDGKSTLEMGLLGSIGIRSYPVTIGMQPDRYSHVYLNIVVPPGKTKFAGQVIPADPIMQDWPLGKEAPADKVKAKKLYASIAGIGPDMTLGAYATSASYLSPQDEMEASQVPAVLASRRTDATTRGRIPTTTEVHLDNSDDLDAMFDREINQFPGQNTPKSRFYNRGPTIGQHAAVETSFLTDAQPMNISARWKRLYVSTGNMTKGVQQPGQEMGPVVGELIGLADFVINGLGAVAKLCKGCKHVAGKKDPIHKISAAAHLAAHTAAKVKRTRIAYSAGLFGEGEDQGSLIAAVERLADVISTKADQVANLAAPSAERREMLRTNLGYLADLDAKFGVTDKITNTPTLIVDGFNSPAHVELLTRLLSSPALLQLSQAYDNVVATGRAPGTSTVSNPLRDEAVVEGREDSDLAGWGTNIRQALGALIMKAGAAVAGIVNAPVKLGQVVHAGGVPIPARRHGPKGDAAVAAAGAAGLQGFGSVFHNVVNTVVQTVAKAPVSMIKTVALPLTAPIAAAKTLASGGTVSQALNAAKNTAVASVQPLTSAIQSAAPGKINPKKPSTNNPSQPANMPDGTYNPVCDPTVAGYSAATCQAATTALNQQMQANPQASAVCTVGGPAYNAAACAALTQNQANPVPNMSNGTYNAVCDTTSPSYNVTACQQAQAALQTPAYQTPAQAYGTPNMADGTYNPVCDSTSPSYNLTSCQQAQAYIAQQQQYAAGQAQQSMTSPYSGSAPTDSFGPDDMGPAFDESSATSDGGGDPSDFDPGDQGGGPAAQSFTQTQNVSSNFDDGSDDQSDSSSGGGDGGDGGGGDDSDSGSGPAGDQGGGQSYSQNNQGSAAPNANLPDGAYNPVCDSTNPAFNAQTCAALVQAMVAQGATSGGSGQSSGGRRHRGSNSGDGSDDDGGDSDSMNGIVDVIKGSPLLAVGALGLGIWFLTRKKKRRA